MKSLMEAAWTTHQAEKRRAHQVYLAQHLQEDVKTCIQACRDAALRKRSGTSCTVTHTYSERKFGTAGGVGQTYSDQMNYNAMERELKNKGFVVISTGTMTMSVSWK